MPRAIGPFLCGCGCGEHIKTKATERRHLAAAGAGLYIRYSQAGPEESSSEALESQNVSDNIPMEMDFDSARDDTESDQYDDMDLDEPPGLNELSESDSESEDEFFAGDDAIDEGWESDESSGDWDEGEEPWQQGLDQGDRLGGIFEAEAAEAAQNLAEADLNDIRAFNFKADT
ncbi:hypothetical protein B0H14DRAFT_2573915 [Mycena olivaceomarginata]|nr:hypothetical protein B0H14DRAFT_2573915 [Mycena olivaceomarginata]